MHAGFTPGQRTYYAWVSERNIDHTAHMIWRRKRKTEKKKEKKKTQFSGYWSNKLEKKIEANVGQDLKWQKKYQKLGIHYLTHNPSFLEIIDKAEPVSSDDYFLGP